MENDTQSDKLTVLPGLIDGAEAEIIQFPAERIKRRRVANMNTPTLPEDEEEVMQRRLDVALMQSAALKESIATAVLAQLRLSGCLTDKDPLQMKCLMFLIESVDSLVRRCYRVPHLFQQFANTLIVEGDDGVLSISNEIGVQFVDLTKLSSEMSIYEGPINMDGTPA